ncbi:MAG: helix-turn-helix transcriptional regulator [Clostridia bacterium]|nr:helix-turn-helix transcriptional regulator [Clostridia bacterium]
MAELVQGKKVGAKLKKLLKERNLTQEEFAYKFGTTARTVRRWIKDFPNLATLEQLAEFFGISIKDFFDE